MKKIIFLVSLIVLLAGAQVVSAGAEHNVSGWAWSSGAGWISFNNTTGGGAINYGVNINTENGEMSGYAWSEIIGWISFNTSNLTGCPSGECKAEVDTETGEISGWARALAPIGQPLEKTGGWDGWISLGGANYDISINSSPDPSEFEGWAWGGDKVIGWISFNCSNQSQCGTSNYKVTTSFNANNLPNAINLSFSNDSNDPIVNCGASEPPVYLDWTFDDPGDTQSGYKIQVDDNSNFSSPIVNEETNSSSERSVADGLSFGGTYYWRLKVKDSQGAWSSDWIYPSPTSFTAPVRWPDPSFTWNPEDPLAEEEIDFNGSVNYCSSCSYLWNFGDGVGTSTLQDPTYEYSEGNKVYSVSFRATSGSRSCEIRNDLNVGSALQLPEWKEVVPF